MAAGNWNSSSEEIEKGVALVLMASLANLVSPSSMTVCLKI